MHMLMHMYFENLNACMLNATFFSNHEPNQTVMASFVDLTSFRFNGDGWMEKEKTQTKSQAPPSNGIQLVR